ncbi:hypothetical protein, partial [Thioflexithrix psekupsensis]
MFVAKLHKYVFSFFLSIPKVGADFSKKTMSSVNEDVREFLHFGYVVYMWLLAFISLASFALTGNKPDFFIIIYSISVLFFTVLTIISYYVLVKPIVDPRKTNQSVGKHGSMSLTGFLKFINMLVTLVPFMFVLPIEFLGITSFLLIIQKVGGDIVFWVVFSWFILIVFFALLIVVTKISHNIFIECQNCQIFGGLTEQLAQFNEIYIITREDYAKLRTCIKCSKLTNTNIYPYEILDDVKVKGVNGEVMNIEYID